MSYEYVPKNESKPFSLFCSQIMNEVKLSLQKNGIFCTVYGIGSYAKNMVTRNGKAPYDLDYNLEIIKPLPQKYSDLKKLKNLVRNEMDKKLQNTGFSYGKDSKSVITYILHLPKKSQMKFSFDIGIVSRNKNGNLQRLIHNKANDSFTWNEAKDSKGLNELTKFLKNHGHTEEIKTLYLKKKNAYLSKNQKEHHPSFNVYIETINELYKKYFDQSKKRKKAHSKKENQKIAEMRKLIGMPDFYQSIGQLYRLYQNGFIEEPVYTPKEIHGQNGNPLWNCTCGVNGYGGRINTEPQRIKKEATRIVAFGMLQIILGYKKAE